MTTTQPTATTVSGDWAKPWPNIDHDSQEFWDGLTRHELLLWTCSTCGAQYWPKTYCIKHDNEAWAANMSWQPGSGFGKLFAFNVHHWAFHPGFADDVPYAYALIELDEGPLISSTLVDGVPSQSDVGRRVQVVFEDHPDQGFTIPRFRLVSE